MKKLLIGYDGSPCAEAALEDLDHAGLPAELDVVLMSVAEVWLPAEAVQFDPVFPGPFPASVQTTRELARQAVESARVLAARAGERLRAMHPGWKIEAEACADSPGWALVKRAEAWGADLVVVGSHGRSLLERVFLGGVSQRVAAEARCSVRIVRSRRRTDATCLRLLLAVDGAEDSKRAVDEVIARAWPKSTEVRLVTVIDPRLESALAWSEGFARDWLVEHDQGVREGVCRLVEDWSSQLAKAGLSTETSILEGDPKHELIKAAAAWAADAIFLGAHGRQHGTRLTLGTTASGVAARAHCTVEVVRAR